MTEELNRSNNSRLQTFQEGEYMPRISISTSDTRIQIKCPQLPVRLASNIYKALDRYMELCGLHLDTVCFAHRHLSDGCSRFGRRGNLLICVADGKTEIVVYPQVLSR